jgi:acetyltransferase
MTVRNLDALFQPRSVAVIGASPRPRSVGSVVLQNLLQGGFRGPILAVNPKHEEVHGVRSWPDVARLPESPDLGVICTPPATVPGIVRGLRERGARAAVVLTAGLGDRARELLEEARPGTLRILGPNCLGMLAPHAGLNASFAHRGAQPGRVAFVAQSGALCTAVLDWGAAHDVGFSCLVSLGDSLDVDAGDMVDWLSSDPHTRAILLYLESIRHARKFLSAARAASRNKPVIAIKAGRAEAGKRAAASHTGALAGADDVIDYALRRAGILRVSDIDELFDAAETLALAKPLRGERLCLLTNGGGPGVLAVDRVAAAGGKLTELSASTVARLDAVLPANWSKQNPVDIIGDAPPERFRDALAIVGQDPGADAVLAMYAPTAVTGAAEAARAVVEAAPAVQGSLLVSWVGTLAEAAAHPVFTAARIPAYRTPGDAVRAFLRMVEYRRNREILMQTPRPLPRATPDEDGARRIATRALDAGREWLGAPEAEALLAAYGVPMVASRVALGEDDAVARAAALGYPVAVKVLSPDVLHKTDVGGVVLDVEGPQELRHTISAMRERIAAAKPGAVIEGFLIQRMSRRPHAHELMIGAAVDPVFGPFVLCGQGGIAVETLDDKAIALPPLDASLAAELVSRTRISRLLAGYRNRPAVDFDALYTVLVRVAELVVAVPEIAEMDINPLLVDSEGVLALDARVRVERAAGDGTERLAIRPYPQDLETRATLPSGLEVIVRPIRPEDEAAHAELFHALRPDDVRFRFFGLVREMPHSELARYTQIDYDREMALVAIDARDGTRELGVVRAISDPDNVAVEFAVVVRSDSQGRGLGRFLLQKIIEWCRARGAQRLVGRVLRENQAMLGLARELGFTIAPDAAAGELEIRLPL